jgi:ferrous-iron efflux pump FieF
VNEEISSSYVKLVRRAALAASATAIFLILLKALAWGASGSASLLASLTDSLMDFAASGLNLLAIHFATVPADRNHRFGHGKAEGLAALAQSTFISGSGVLLVLHGIDRLLHPSEIQAMSWAVMVTLVAILATLLLLLLQRHVINKTGSTAIKADALHYRSDLLMNAGILVALGLTQYGIPAADALFAILIAGYMIFSAVKIGIEATHSLLDHELPGEQQEIILSLAKKHPKVHGVHDLRTRQAGQTRFVQLHLELDDNLRLLDAHRIADEVEEELKRELPDADILIHLDPLSVLPAERRDGMLID